MTGASGFVGGAVATALARDGHEVLALGRRPAGWAPPAGGAGRYATWDLERGPVEAAAPELASELRAHPADAVVHAAALADDWAPLARAMRINRDGTAHVRAALPGARFVHVSSSSVADPRRPEVNAGAEPPATRHLGAYGASKAAAERLLDGTDAVILRPHAVYGPGDTTLLPRIEAAARGGRLRLPRGGRVRHSFTHIDTLVDAVRLALDPAARPGVYPIADAEPVLLAEVVTEFLARRGRPARIVAVPFALADGAAALSEACARITGHRPRLTRYAVAQLGRERTYDLRAAREGLGLQPRPTTLEGCEAW
ncbi:MAG: NAD-dependent epimerase/dehydratase family protein [Actinomycetales bacterium]|nr:NAD-dependent epimerase/dehydratase family protein [Actinomycetales bacterium]